MVNRDLDLAAMRENYELGSLDIDSVAADPLSQWKIWFDEAVAAKLLEPNAAVVSSVDEQGFPQSRVLLIKGTDEHGLIFYTNYSSAKAQEFHRCAKAALLFSWLDLQRQVRMSGVVEKVDEAVSDAYFASRPRESQIGAWASPQSAVITSRSVLETRAAQSVERFGTEAIPRPDNWGGYRFVASRVEFWQGRPSRLHDRIVYTRTPGSVSAGTVGKWQLSRLAP